MSIVSLHGVSLNLGGRHLLDKVDWSIEANEKIALVGRNGAGKSSLLKVLQGTLPIDAGEINQQNGLLVAGLSQEVPEASQAPVYHFLLHGLGEIGQLITRFYDLSAAGESEALSACQQAMDNASAWEYLPKVEMMAQRLGVEMHVAMAGLSGGMKRRVLLAAALISEPAMLLLDEPTNHLDIAAIEWLESYLKNYTGTVILVTHDRTFLSAVAEKIIEIDRGKLHTFSCSYEQYLDRREAMRLSEQKQQALFDKKLAEEEAWIRQGIKARRTRNEGRVRALKALRETYRQRRSEPGKMKAFALETQKSGKLVLEAEQLSYAIDKRPLIQDFSLLMSRGDKIGIIGPNGCGKTTLIRLLTKELKADTGSLRLGTSVDIAYFDQLRQQLDDKQTLMNNVAEGSDFVTIQGKQQHVASYLQQFLFRPEQLNQPVSVLSGGERNRLMLAKIFARPVNLLIMDEPSNDLDMESLELLESMLLDYQGSLLLISHDRTLINHVVSSVLVYEGQGQFNEYIGGYEDYLRQKKEERSKTKIKTVSKTSKVEKSHAKLTYNEQRELAALPQKIEALEAEIEALQQEMSHTDFYQKDAETIAAVKKKLEEQEGYAAELYARWEMLEARK